MRNQGRSGSSQVDPNHGETGQTGHGTGHGSLRRLLRRVLGDGLKGLAHGVLADEIDRLIAQRDQRCAEARTRALQENAHLRAGLTEIANNRHAGVRVGGVGGCTDNCPTCIAVEALRLADAAGAPPDTAPTGQKVVTSDGRRAGGCWWTCRHGKRCTKGSGHDGDHDYQGCACAKPDALCGRCDTPLGRRPTQGALLVTCSGCGAVVTLTPPHDLMGEG